MEINDLDLGQKLETSRNPLSLDKGWKYRNRIFNEIKEEGRNPLSLDKGWKFKVENREISKVSGRNPLSLDKGWKSVQFLIR